MGRNNENRKNRTERSDKMMEILLGLKICVIAILADTLLGLGIRLY